MKATAHLAGTGGRSVFEERVMAALSRLYADADAQRERRKPLAARVVVLGGGTGLSTVLGGNSSLASWVEQEPAGLLHEFSQVDTGVCTTDDGGSTGELVRRLPMIGIGDTRKVMLSMVDRSYWAQRYGDRPAATIVQQVFLHRFGERAPARAELRDPVRVLPASLRRACPAELRESLAAWTKDLPPWLETKLRVPGHSLGNLILTAAIFRGVPEGKTPSRAQVLRAVDEVARAVGAPVGRLHPASAVPGALIYEYANGVVATGQARAARARRGCAVRRVQIAFAGGGQGNPRLISRLKKADLIIYAPGSLYSSMLPVLLTPGVAEAIRANRRAIKILGANLWIQEGETDMSFREARRGFWVSELIEAYKRNVPGGAEGLFDVALATSLDPLPGGIIRSYALEDKHPIHLDRARVSELGVIPIEADLVTGEPVEHTAMIHHDPLRFALAVRAIYESWPQRVAEPASPSDATAKRPKKSSVLIEPVISDRMALVEKKLAGKKMTATLRREIADFWWEHQDVLPEHLDYFDGVQVVAESKWQRSREWDNVLGYYDPQARQIVLHNLVLKNKTTWQANFAVALGEALLGSYIARKWWEPDVPGAGARTYNIQLRAAGERECYLGPRQLHQYLTLAQMMPQPGRKDCYSRLIAEGSGFLPSGVLFGLTYAWMLANEFAPALDFEMQTLLWPVGRLLPYQAQTRARQQELVRFFRAHVFGRR